MVTVDEIPDPQALELTTTLNGTVVQHTGTDLMIFSVAELINYCSSFSPLSPGDVIATGTPGGVGFKREPPLYMRAGDVIEVKISNIATLTNKLAPEPAQ
jgi:2-keto-4-pentenoate hydratase/2-oxohepta-3-ene-1,7-dioic acid hydratase in catechol pathway